MKVLLMHRDRDFDLKREPPWNAQALIEDLELGTLEKTMASGHELVSNVARQALLAGLENDCETILYRQAILKDCLNNPSIIRELFGVAEEVVARKRTKWLFIFSRQPSGILYDAIALMQMLVEMLRRLRLIAEAHAARFSSEGFRNLFAMIEKELSNDYLDSVQQHLKELNFGRGVLLSAELGDGNQGSDYMLRQPKVKLNWLQRFFGVSSGGFAFRLHPRDEAGARIVSEIRDNGINLVANALAQSAEHVLSFFEVMRVELAFYIGCLNLSDRLSEKSEPICFPTPAGAGERRHHFEQLYDVCLSLSMECRIVGNTVNANGKDVIVITGTNQGGKSVFLRSIGLAQLMMQCGMFVAAASFDAGLCPRLCTHYKRGEDAMMKSGKFDEELARMSDIVGHLCANALLLCNESFAATNEHEGSEIARQIVSALAERRIKVVFVTHLYEFAHRLCEQNRRDVMFLRAQRQADGTRTYRLVEAEPLDTSYGKDLYEKVFATDEVKT